MQTVATGPPVTEAKLSDQIEVFILSHPKKECHTAALLKQLDIPFQVFSNIDWEWPADHPELATNRDDRPVTRDYALRQYRAFKGHQHIMSLADQDKFTLVFEDDVTSDECRTNILRHLNEAVQFIQYAGYDAVSFHARDQSPPCDSYALFDREYIELSAIPQTAWGHRYFLAPVTTQYKGKYADYNFKWHIGCLGYLIGKSGREVWKNAGHGGGMPCDLFLANEMHTIVMRNSIFTHDVLAGSLISDI